MTLYAIYGMAPIGVGGVLEADGQVYYYCSADHATKDVAGLGMLPPDYSDPQPSTGEDMAQGTICDYCGKELTP